MWQSRPARILAPACTPLTLFDKRRNCVVPLAKKDVLSAAPSFVGVHVRGSCVPNHCTTFRCQQHCHCFPTAPVLSISSSNERGSAYYYGLITPDPSRLCPHEINLCPPQSPQTTSHQLVDQ